jgi:hypothetical protein
MACALSPDSICLLLLQATEPAAANPLAALKRQLTRILSRGRPTPEAYDHPKDHFDSPNSVRDFPDGGRTPSTPGVTIHGDQTPPGQQHGPVHVTVVVNNPHRENEAEPLMPVPPPPPKKRAPWPKRLASVFSPKNLVDMGGVLDPAVLFIMLAFCVAVRRGLRNPIKLFHCAIECCLLLQSGSQSVSS